MSLNIRASISGDFIKSLFSSWMIWKQGSGQGQGKLNITTAKHIAHTTKITEQLVKKRGFLTM